MKVAPGELEGFVRRPPAGLRGVLVYGADGGKARETAERIGRSVVADLSDPFNVAVLTGEEAEADPARLADEAAARSLMGGRRLVRVRDARDRSAEALSNAFAGPETDTLVVVEAGDLKSTSALRKLFEGKRGDLAAIRCYPDEASDVIRMIRETLSAAGVRIDPDAAQMLSERLGNDRVATRTEIEKLALMAGDGGTVDYETAIEAVGEALEAEAEDWIDAVTALSGGGPAYVFLLIEALSAAGVKSGLPEAFAMRLARATVSGSGELARRSPEPASQLRVNVTSPGGTTAEALKVLMDPASGIQPIFDRAIAAATARSRELAG